MRNVPRIGASSQRSATARSGAITSSWIERRRCRRRRQTLAVQLDEIDRVEQQRLEAAIAHRRGDDLARERKQQARAFDQYERLQAVRRYIHDTKHAGEDQFEAVQHQAVGFRLAFQTQRHLEVGLARGRGFDIDLNVDRRLLRARRQRTRRVRVLERQILHVLAKDGDLRHRHLRRGTAICRRHPDLRRARVLRAWLTQGRGANNGGRPASRGAIMPPISARLLKSRPTLLRGAGHGRPCSRYRRPAMLARRRQSFRLWHGHAVVMSCGLWMAPRACLHNEWEPGSRFAIVALGLSFKERVVPPIAMPRECQTCSTSTPSSFWRSQYSFSCGFAASWANAPGASGRPMTRIRRVTWCAARRPTRS